MRRGRMFGPLVSWYVIAVLSPDTCAAGTPAADNNCNGLDESCSGTADDGYVVTDTSCGVGECSGRWSAGM